MLPHADGVSPNSHIRSNETADGHYLKRLHTFGDDVVALRLPREKVGAANVKGRIGTWVGHSIHQDAQLVYFPDKRKIELVYHARVYPGAPFRLNKLSNLMAPKTDHRPPQIKFDDGEIGSSSIDSSRSDGRNPHDVPYDILEPTVTDDIAESDYFHRRQPLELTGRGPTHARLPTEKQPGQSDSIGLPERQIRALEDSYIEQPVEQDLNDLPVEPIPLTHENDEDALELPTPTLTGSISDRITKAIAHGTKVTFQGSKRAHSASGIRWANYHTAKTLHEASELGCQRSDMKWDLEKGLLQIHDGLGTPDQANAVIDRTADNSKSVVEQMEVDPVPASVEHTSNRIVNTTTSKKRNKRPFNVSDELLHDQVYAVLSANFAAFDHVVGSPPESKVVFPTALESLHIANAVKNEPSKPNDLPVTNSYTEAKEWQRQGINNGDKWVAAFEAEVESFKTFNTFLRVRRSEVPKYSTILTGKFTGKIKVDAQGNPTRWKQRWVVRGYLERFSEHFFRTNASTLGIESAFMLLSLAASNGWHLRLIDWANAYQTGAVDNDAMFIQMPRGFEEYDNDGTEFVYQLVGNIYGTRSAGRIFGRFRDKTLHQLGFIKFKSDRNLFYRLRGEHFIFIADFALTIH
jgi:hypothetical protein